MLAEDMLLPITHLLQCAALNGVTVVYRIREYTWAMHAFELRQHLLHL